MKKLYLFLLLLLTIIAVACKNKATNPGGSTEGEDIIIPDPTVPIVKDFEEAGDADKFANDMKKAFGGDINPKYSSSDIRQVTSTSGDSTYGFYFINFGTGLGASFEREVNLFITTSEEGGIEEGFHITGMLYFPRELESPSDVLVSSDPRINMDVKKVYFAFTNNLNFPDEYNIANEYYLLYEKK